MRTQHIHPLQSVLAISLGFIIVFLSTKIWSLLWTALVIMTIGILSERISILIHQGWMFLAQVLSAIVPKIMLTIIYFLVLTPLAFLKNLITKSDSLSLKNNSSSLFKDHNQTYDPKSFENPW